MRMFGQGTRLARRALYRGQCSQVRGEVTFMEPELSSVPRSPYFSRITKARGMVWISGTGGNVSDIGGDIDGDLSPAEETQQALRNMSNLLEAAGSSMERVVSVMRTNY
eukprot:TRINITY_DN5051_c0_g2_i2.p1 TRINITY_DN5051_c0_g2~~TRINITY_DN5051_c0_g2_i2.p1  ORF type:complete len:109 (-),score=13.87 TRINITY_DN5051_c0_g2_i2:266-592(-)